MAGLLAGRQLGMPKCRSSCRSSHAGANPAFRAALPRTQLLCPLNRNVRTLGSGTESSKPACSSGVSGELPTTSAGCGRGASEAHRGWLPCCGCLFLQSNDPSKFLGCPCPARALSGPHIRHKRRGPPDRRVFSQTPRHRARRLDGRYRWPRAGAVVFAPCLAVINCAVQLVRSRRRSRTVQCAPTGNHLSSNNVVINSTLTRALAKRKSATADQWRRIAKVTVDRGPSND